MSANKPLTQPPTQQNPADMFTKNKFIDKMLKIIPENPVYQSQYIYYLTIIVFFGLAGFAVATWIGVVTMFTWTALFRGVFMSAISLLSLYGLKQSRASFHTIRAMYGKTQKQELKVESLDEMIAEFAK